MLIICSLLLVFSLVAVVVNGYLRSFAKPTIKSKQFELKILLGDEKSIHSGILNALSGQLSLEDTEKREKTHSKQSKLFSRTNRIHGIEKWTNEMLRYHHFVRFNTSIAPDIDHVTSLVEISKELLFSGIPEQSVDLFNVYLEVLRNDDLSKLSFVLPDPRLVTVTVRALLAMNDVNGALKLLQYCSRLGVTFDSESKSMVISELALSSEEGLRAALNIKASMTSRNEPINLKAQASIIRGINLYGACHSSIDQSIILHSLIHGFDDDLVESKVLFDMDELASLASDIVHDHMESRQKSKRSDKIFREFFRLQFGSQAPVSSVNQNFIDDEEQSKELQSDNAIAAIFDVLDEYDLNWDVNLADALLEGCLKFDDKINALNVIQAMELNNIPCRTSTCNMLLSKYEEIGDGESAFKFYYQVLKSNKLCSPDGDSLRHLLAACMKTTRGQYIARVVLADLIAESAMDKYAWDTLMCLKIIDNSSIMDVIKDYPIQSFQMNDETIIRIINTYAKYPSRANELIDLFDFMFKAEKIRSSYVQSIFKDPKETTNRPMTLVQYANELNPSWNEFYFHLPTPSLKTMSYLFDFMKLSKQVDASMDMLGRFINQSLRSKTSQSTNYSPNADLYSLVMEICIEGEEPMKAFLVFQLLEAFLKRSEPSKDQLTLSPDIVNVGLVNETVDYPKLSRRIYRNLIKAFGLKKDLPSAMGVFQEMISVYKPDMESLLTLLRLCQSSPHDLRNSVSLLESLASDPRIDLDLYSKDILMQGFPDAISLGKTLTTMEKYALSAVAASKTRAKMDLGTSINEPVATSITVLSVLVQTIRKDTSLQGLIDALLYLGSIGIMADEDTMEYFRMGPEVNPPMGSPHSRHMNRVLIPNRQRTRSLLHMELPSDFRTDFRLIDDIVSNYKSKYESLISVDSEPYHQTGSDRYGDIARAITEYIQDSSSIDVSVADMLETETYHYESTAIQIEEDVDGNHESEMTIILDDFNLQTTTVQRKPMVQRTSATADKTVFSAPIGGKYDVNASPRRKSKIPQPLSDYDHGDDEGSLFISRGNTAGMLARRERQRMMEKNKKKSKSISSKPKKSFQSNDGKKKTTVSTGARASSPRATSTRQSSYPRPAP